MLAQDFGKKYLTFRLPLPMQLLLLRAGYVGEDVEKYFCCVLFRRRIFDVEKAETRE
jgi:ATP-dependent protease Clp ATPase subunit